MFIMEQGNKIFSPNTTTEGTSNISRRDAVKKITSLGLGAAFLASPLKSIAETISPNEARVNKEYEQFITNQVNEITEIIESKAYYKILSNPYLAYCLHCLQTYLDKVSDPKNQRDVPEKIIGSIAHLVTPEFRAQAILFLEEQTKEKERLENKKISARKVLPLNKFKFDKGKNHEIANKNV